MGTSSIEWVVLGYLLSLAVFIPASGWIGDRVGTKRTFLFALAVFTSASALCGLATSLDQLVVFRFLQGVGGGMLTPVGLAMLFRTFPPEQRARASRILIVPTVLAPALGPVIGGLLVDRLSWRWIFYVNLPIGIGAFFFGLFFLREHREPRAGGFDVLGFVLSGVGLALILYALHDGSTNGWGSVRPIAVGLVGVTSFALLTVVELHKPHPMLKLQLLRDRLFRSTNVVSVFGYGSFIGLLFVMPLFLQEVRGLSALDSGLTTFPEAIGVLVSSQIVARLYVRVGPRRLMVSGLVGVTVCLVVLSRMDLGTDLWVIRALMFLIGAGMAYMIMPLQAATFATITPADTGQASAIFSTQRQMAAAVGVAVLATVLSTALPTPEGGGAVPPADQVSAYQTVILVAAAMALVGAVASLAIHDSDAAATMRPRKVRDPEPVAH